MSSGHASLKPPLNARVMGLRTADKMTISLGDFVHSDFSLLVKLAIVFSPLLCVYPIAMRYPLRAGHAQIHGLGDASLRNLCAIPVLASHIMCTVYIRNSVRGAPHADVEKISHASRAFHVGEVERVCHA